VQIAALRQSFDGGHVVAGHLAHGRDARALRHTVDVAGARTAEAHATAELQAVDVEAVTQDPEQFLVVVGVD